ncbi:hypothetical protein ALC57_15691 [Trachymyrmex cornetzi]|uniref:Regulatory protein zeste n=1 Tax=Trachymyrmex cornetzi TaxID=471704 RepID=A0A151IWR6_9HYME|nr:hypothetical protein ALC57_15691 [Trachymyrmex cornetzi]
MCCEFLEAEKIILIDLATHYKDVIENKRSDMITCKKKDKYWKVIEKEESTEFVSKVKSQISVVGENNIFNSDQSGFNLETHAGRTLVLKGSLKVECLAQSLNSLTHSYTIQPIISASGELKSPLLIVLQESNGKFDPVVEKTLYKANNIVALASKSGKLTSDIAAKWFAEVFLPIAGENSVLLLDSWTGQTKSKFDNIDTGNRNVNIITIPPGTTGLIQSLDVYAFRLHIVQLHIVQLHTEKCAPFVCTPFVCTRNDAHRSIAHRSFAHEKLRTVRLYTVQTYAIRRISF